MSNYDHRLLLGHFFYHIIRYILSILTQWNINIVYFTCRIGLFSVAVTIFLSEKIIAVLILDGKY